MNITELFYLLGNGLKTKSKTWFACVVMLTNSRLQDFPWKRVTSLSVTLISERERGHPSHPPMAISMTKVSPALLRIVYGIPKY